MLWIMFKNNTGYTRSDWHVHERRRVLVRKPAVCLWVFEIESSFSSRGGAGVKICQSRCMRVFLNRLYLRVVCVAVKCLEVWEEWIVALSKSWMNLQRWSDELGVAVVEVDPSCLLGSSMESPSKTFLATISQPSVPDLKAPSRSWKIHFLFTTQNEGH